MSAQGDLVYPDAAGTPVNHTFKPMGQIPGTAWWLWQDQSPSDAVGYPELRYMLRRPNGANRNYKVAGALMWPGLEIVGTAGYGAYQAPPKRAFEAYFRFEAVVPERAGLQFRKDMQKIGGAFAYGSAGSPSYDGIVTLEGVW